MGRGGFGGGNGMPMRGGGRGQPQSGGRRANGKTGESTVYVSPGTYEVGIARGDSFLTGVSATGAQSSGRIVKISDGAPHLLVHLAAGLATVEGVASRQGKATQGAMVLLVPATLGDPASLNILRRAQTATDGSFTLTGVIPGQYILLALGPRMGCELARCRNAAPLLARRRAPRALCICHSPCKAHKHAALARRGVNLC